MDTIEYWKRQWNSISDTRNVANNSDAIEQEQRRGIYYYDTKGKLVRHENSEEYRNSIMKKILIVCLIMLCSATSLYAQHRQRVDSILNDYEYYTIIDKRFVRKDSCYVYVNKPGISEMEGTRYISAGFRIELPLYVTNAVNAMGGYKTIFFVDTTGYIMMRQCRAGTMSEFPEDDFEFCLNTFRADDGNNPLIESEDVIYLAKRFCALFLFCNIPYKDIRKILDSFEHYVCPQVVCPTKYPIFQE